MDPQLTAQYHAKQRPPVFGRRLPTPERKRPFWPLLIYATLLGFASVLVITLTIHPIMETLHHVVR